MRIPATNIVLFLLTLLTTTMAGADAAGAPVTYALPLHANLLNLTNGLSFSIPLMLILLAHEMGHYSFARRYGVDTTLPYFIPAPFPSLFFIGTFGAFIRMRSPRARRRAMFDIGAAGPWAGFIVAMIAIVIGLHLSTVSPLDNSAGGLQLGNSLIFWTISRAVLGVNPNSVNVDLHPIAFAGWLGLFVTALNLLPIGQLDGGHVIYSLLGGRWHRAISRLFAAGCLLMVVVPWALHMSVLVRLGPVVRPGPFPRSRPSLNDGRRYASGWTPPLDRMGDRRAFHPDFQPGADLDCAAAGSAVTTCRWPELQRDASSASNHPSPSPSFRRVHLMSNRSRYRCGAGRVQ